MDEQPEPVVLGIKSVMMEWSMAEGELTGHGVVTFRDGFTLSFVTSRNPTSREIRETARQARLIAANAVRD